LLTRNLELKEDNSNSFLKTAFQCKQYLCSQPLETQQGPEAAEVRTVWLFWSWITTAHLRKNDTLCLHEYGNNSVNPSMNKQGQVS